MVTSFNFSGIPRIYFGPGYLSKLPEVLDRFGTNYLIITGASSFTSSSKGKNILDVLESRDFTIYRGRIIKEPSPTDIDEIVFEYKRKNINAVVAIGGGSVLDAGKAISAMLPLAEPVKDYIEGVGNKIHPGIKIPFIALPTTSGTGSETTKNSVISEVGKHGFKRSLRHDNFIPDVVIVDPELTFDCPPEITAASGMDALSQLIESYISTGSNDFTDSLAQKAIMLICSNLLKAVDNGYDLEARSAMSYSAMISGITLANAGLGVVHGFASSIGGIIDIPHGILCGTLMGIANRVIVEKLINDDPDGIALEKYALLGHNLVNNTPYYTKVEYALAFVKFIEDMTEKLNLPKLSQFGLTEQKIKETIADTGQKNNPATLTREDMIRILQVRL